MFQLSALNDSTENVSGGEKPLKDTKEAQEAQAFNLYNEALRLQQNDRKDEAVAVYERLLETPLVIESATTLVNEYNEAIEHPLKDPGLILKYSAHKNVASICASQGHHNKAMENYLQAVMLDTSDVTLWYRIGILAAKLSNLHLSRRALTQGLECNPNHWPCLDSVITVCYAILDYENCLMWIAKALKKDSHYKKGIYLRRKMITECPHLKKHFDPLFRNCGTEVFEMEISDEEMKEVLREPLTLRENFRKLCIPPEIPVVPLKIPLKTFSWLNLGKSLIATYEFIEKQDEPISITSPINMKVNEKDVESEKHNGTLPKSNFEQKTPNTDLSKIENQVNHVSKTNSMVSGNESVNGSVNITESMKDVNMNMASSIEGSCDSSIQKKSIKRKKPPEKIADQGRRSERRSSRMKPKFQTKSIDEVCFSPDPDFRHALLQLIPRTLQLQQQSSVPMDLDSDTNSQGSSLPYPDSDTGHFTSMKEAQKSPVAQSLNQEMELVVSISDVNATSEKDDNDITIESTAKQSDTGCPETSNEVSKTSDSIEISKEPSQTALSVGEGKSNEVFEATENSEAVKESSDMVSTSKQIEPSEKDKSSNNVELLQEPCGPNPPSKRIKLEAIEAFESTPFDDSNIQQSPTPLKDAAGQEMLSRKISSAVDESEAKTVHGDCKPSPVAEKSDMNVELPRDAPPEETEEAKQIREFIEKYNDNHSGILHLLQLYCKWMGRRSHLVWEKGLTEVFLRAFSITQPSLKLEAFMENNLDDENRIMFAFYLLTHLECVLDKNYRKCSLDFSFRPTSLEYKDMDYIIQASCHPEVFELDSMPEYRFKFFVLRYHWVRANYFFLSGDKSSALSELTVCSKLCMEDSEVPLQHLENHNKINHSLINKRIGSLKRFQLLEEIEDLLAKELFSKALEILSANIVFEDIALKDKHRILMENIPVAFERPQLLTYMVKAALGVDDIRSALENISKILWEATEWMPYLVKKKFAKDVNSSKLHEKWRSLSNLCCSSLLSILDKNLENLALLEKEDLAKLTDCMVSLNHYNLSHLPSKSQLMVKTSYARDIFRPWILLYKLIKFSESQLGDISKGEVPPSIKLLITAHEWLGEKGCCCVDGGMLLRLLMKNSMEILTLVESNSPTKQGVVNTSSVDFEKTKNVPSNQKVNLRTCIEQCFYCLFSYPNKIAKSSPLCDHGAQQTNLKWQDVFQLYSYFKPRTLPAFDSYKINTMLSEMAGLLTRIVKLMPENISTKLSKLLYKLEDFLKNGDATKDFEVEPVCGSKDMEIIKDIYYLLADYCFKNNDMAQAGKYYMYDLCVNPRRFDSWAGFALVKSSILDQYLRLCSTKLVNEVTSKPESVVEYSKITLVCYKKAMNIEGSSTTLWIEYGTLAYWMHSYLSRRLTKRLRNDEMTLKKNQKKSMLDQAEKCFEMALSCDSDDISSEEWLILYMLGKVHEKNRAPPKKYLPNYMRAASLLHRKHAKYPKKIQFKSYQTDYAIEALEMYFRLHSSILKLVQHELNVLKGFDDGETRPRLMKEDFELMNDLIDEAEGSNFVRRESLPINQFYEKPTDLTNKKTTTQPKLAVPEVESNSKLSMGTLVPDSVVSALSIQLPVDSAPNDENTMEADEEGASKDTDVENAAKMGEINLLDNQDKPAPRIEESVSSEHMVKKDSEPTLLDDASRNDLCLKLVKSCVSAIHLCLGRLPQHYKAIYRLASLYRHCNPDRQETTWCRDLILGSETPWQQLKYMPCQGLLSERNKTNLFNGVWKIPVDEIDRPGSFGFHLYRCILLLLEVLLVLQDHSKLFYLHNMLNRTPDQGRKYLQDTDRVLLCKKALSYSIKALHKKVNSLASGTSTPVVSADHPIARERFRYLLDAAKICQQKQRMGNPSEEILPKKQGSSEQHKELLIMSYEKYIAISPPIGTPLPNLDFIPAVVKVERILKFCQQHASIHSVKSSLPSSVIQTQTIDSKVTEVGNKTSQNMILSSAGENSSAVMAVSDMRDETVGSGFKLSNEISQGLSNSEECSSQESFNKIPSTSRQSGDIIYSADVSDAVNKESVSKTGTEPVNQTLQDVNALDTSTAKEDKSNSKLAYPKNEASMQEDAPSPAPEMMSGISSTGFSTSGIATSSPEFLKSTFIPASNMTSLKLLALEEKQSRPSHMVAGGDKSSSAEFCAATDESSKSSQTSHLLPSAKEGKHLEMVSEDIIITDGRPVEKKAASVAEQINEDKPDIVSHVSDDNCSGMVEHSPRAGNLETDYENDTNPQSQSSTMSPETDPAIACASEIMLVSEACSLDKSRQSKYSLQSSEEKSVGDISLPCIRKNVAKLESPTAILPVVSSASGETCSSDQNFIPSKAKLTTVVRGDKKYTKITPSKPVKTCLSPSPHSAFTARKSPMKNLQLEKLKTQVREPVSRSASLPESSAVMSHKTLHRTGSISEYTKQRLKSSILMKTSASLVKKPSITDKEIEQVLDDPESSQSEDDDEIETSFRPLPATEVQVESKSSPRLINAPIALAPVTMSLAIENESDDSDA